MPHSRFKTGNKLLKLWLLQPETRFKETMGENTAENLWNPWGVIQGSTMKVLVRAYTEEDAREYAQQEAGSEQDRTPGGIEVWLSPQYTSCIEVTKYGRIGVVMYDKVPE
jgi:hypothetical protein